MSGGGAYFDDGAGWLAAVGSNSSPVLFFGFQRNTVTFNAKWAMTLCNPGVACRSECRRV